VPIEPSLRGEVSPERSPDELAAGAAFEA
jgi:hypothetical protein